jgi:hypothetical protein
VIGWVGPFASPIESVEVIWMDINDLRDRLVSDLDVKCVVEAP